MAATRLANLEEQLAGYKSLKQAEVVAEQMRPKGHRIYRPPNKQT